MENPILTRRVYFLAYFLTWAMLSLVQVSLVFFVFGQGINAALADGFLVNGIRAVTGLAVWFPVRFNPMSGRNLFYPVVSIVATGVVTITFWTGISFLLLRGIFPADTGFHDYLRESLPYRIVTDFLYFSVLVLVYSLIVYSHNLRVKISDEARLKTLVREAELNMLKAQINPHFLFNSLNSISRLTTTDPKAAREMIIRLSEFLRYSLRFTESEMSRLGDETENMEKYLDIEKIRFGDKLIFRKNLEKGTENVLIPNMILQPLLENAIKHGVYESTEPITLEMQAKKKDQSVVIELTNNYDPEAIPRKGAGIGLKNTGERLALIYGRRDLLKYEGTKGIFRIWLEIPLR